jgi:hypothetical protein
MDKVLKNIINKTIEREYENFAQLNYEGALKRSPEEANYQEECSNEMNAVMQKLNKILPKEYHHLIGEFEDAAMGLMSVDAKIAFKEGIILGATNLKYLGEELDIELKCI